VGGGVQGEEVEELIPRHQINKSQIHHVISYTATRETSIKEIELFSLEMRHKHNRPSPPIFLVDRTYTSRIALAMV
jgi:hypothetical protein